MRKVERLRIEALEACENRLHNMNRFEHYAKGRCFSTCKFCGKAVSVIARPAPNEIDIAGEAVALQCED